MKKTKATKGKSSSNSHKSKKDGKKDGKKSDDALRLDAIELLKSQHRDVEALFAELESQTESSGKMAVFKKIADQLAMHTAIEEMHFYPAVRDKRTEDILLESLEEHLGIKRVIADLLGLRAGEETFDAKLKVLQEQVEHHVEEEEQDLFPKVKRIFNQDTLLSIGAAMQTKHWQLEGTNPRERVLVETKEAAPL